MGFQWVELTTSPGKTRIFRSPPEFRKPHPWDAMILRDCHASTDGMIGVESINSRYWDILLVKMCEDFDRKPCILRFVFCNKPVTTCGQLTD